MLILLVDIRHKEIFVKKTSKKLGVGVLFLASLYSVAAFSQEINIENLPPEGRMALRAYDNLVENLGFEGVAIHGFMPSFRGSATVLFRSKNDVDAYIAEIGRTPEGADVFFRVYRDCYAKDILIDKIVSVNGQNIQTGYMCAEVPGNSSKTQEIYKAKTSQGESYIANQFLQKRHVTVRLDKYGIPFSTDGFYEAWGSANQPAL